MHPSQGRPDLPTDVNLLARIRLGSPSRDVVWSEFHKLYAPMIAGFARRLGAKPGDVEDIVQDVLLGFFTKSHEFQYNPLRGKFRGFLKTCTFRALIKRAGKQAKFKGASLDQVNPEAFEVNQEWDQVWDAELMNHAIDDLHTSYKQNPTQLRTFEAFERYVLRQEAADKVAADLGISVDSVHQAKHRMTEAIQKRVAELSKLEDG